MQFHILGPLEVRTNGESLPLGGRKQRALLAILLLNANRVVSRDELMYELWGEHAPAGAAHSLEVNVSRLRKALDTNGNGGGYVMTQAPGYLLRLAPGQLDLDRFQTCVADARTAMDLDDMAGAAELLREGDALWRGRPLADLEFEPFARMDIEHLDELRLGAIEDRVDAELALGRHAELAAELDVLVKDHPLRERLVGQQMLALYQAGRQAEALDAYRRARTVFVDELGLEPTPRLQALQQAILRQDDDLEPPRSGRRTPPSGSRVPALAVARLRPRRRLLVASAAAAATTAVIAAVLLSNGHSVVRPAQANALAFVRGGRLRATIELGSPPARMTAGFGSVWVTSAVDGTVTRIDPKAGSVRDTIPVGDGPSGLVAGYGSVWVANAMESTVSRVDPASDRVTQVIALGSRPSDVALAGGGVWVALPDAGTVVRLDARTGRQTRTIRTGVQPTTLASLRGNVWVSNAGEGTVSSVDARTGRVVHTVHVADTPGPLVAGRGSLWVLDSLDATVTRINPSTGSVRATIAVGGAPRDIAVADGSVWVVDAGSGRVVAIDMRTNSIRRLPRVGDRAVAATSLGGDLWVGVREGGPNHRGGTLRVLNTIPEIPSLDPPVLSTLMGPLAFIGMTNDGLVTFAHVDGPAGSQLVPDLAMTIPAPSFGGRSYTFRLRPGIRYSTGAPVRAGDVRHSIERIFEVGGSTGPSYDAIVGAPKCAHAAHGCDLSRGIIVDDRHRTVTFHLSHADPEFLYKLALPPAYVLPASTPAREAKTPLPATGPYMVRDYKPGGNLRLVRNPYFHEWSHVAQPDGYPDQIVSEVGLKVGDAVKRIVAGHAGFLGNYGPLPAGIAQDIRMRDPGLLHVHGALGTGWLAMNVRAAPFDDVRVRRALNYALDRRRMVQIYGGPTEARPACQILPPAMPGYRPYCPYTRHPNPAGLWRGPDLAKARRLVAASGTKGMRVHVWNSNVPGAYLEESREAVRALRAIGYRASLRLLPTDEQFFKYTNDSRHHAQLVDAGWGADYPAASNFIAVKLRCAAFQPASRHIQNVSEFCDHGIDNEMRRATQYETTSPVRAARLWARLDRQLTDLAVLLPTVNPQLTDVVGRTVGNYEAHPLWGAIIDQMWVR